MLKYQLLQNQMNTTNAINTIELGKAISPIKANPPMRVADKSVDQSDNNGWISQRSNRSPERKQSTRYVAKSQNPFTAEVRRKINYDVSVDNPIDVKTAPATNKTTNWHIVIGIVDDSYAALAAFSFSDEKMQKKGREKVVALANGDKCTIMNVEIKFKLRTGSGFVDTVRKLFKGSQRLVPKGQWISHIVPSQAELSRIDERDPALSSVDLARIRDFPPMVKFVYVKLIREIQRLYRTRVEFGEVVFESAETANTPSPRTSPTLSPMPSPTITPDVAKGFAVLNIVPNFVLIPKDSPRPSPSTKPSPSPQTPECRIRNDIPCMYIINAATPRIIDLGAIENQCPRK